MADKKHYDLMNTILSTGVHLVNPQGQTLVEVKNTPTWRDSAGNWKDRGKTVMGSLAVISITTNETGQTVYHVRRPRESGGDDYAEVTSADFTGTLPHSIAIGGQTIQVADPIRATVMVRSHYNSLSEHEREHLLQQKDEQLRREARDQIEEFLRSTHPASPEGWKKRERLQAQLAGLKRGK